jgi:Domain of Unknown Function with PDB structure (DUF3857)
LNRFILTIFVLLSFNSQAQLFPFYKHHDWQKNPIQEKKVLENELYFFTKYLKCIEYIYDGSEGQYYKYETEHYKVKLSSDAAIEEFNKVYISMEDVVRISKLEARVIKENEVIKLKPKVEEFYSEDEDERYNYFPLSQLELGDEIEILYTVQKQPDFDGDQFFFQSDIPIYDFDFIFIAPNDAYFQFLAHNELDEPQLIDTILQKHQWTISMDSIPAYEPEYFSEYNNTAMKLDVSLRGFDSPTDKSYSPYAEFNELLNGVYNINFEGKDAKALFSLNEQLGVHQMRSKVDKVRRIEHFIKTEMVISNSSSEQTISEIVKNGRSTSIGSILLLMGLCQDADIEYQYGFVSDRYDTKLSDEIESMHFLQNYFIYFPELNDYLAPLDFTTRLGYLSSDWIPNNGYFLKMKKLPVPTTDWEIRAIESTTAIENRDSMIIRIKVNEDMMDGDVSVERHLWGYTAGKYQTYYYLYSDNRRKEKHDDLLNFFKDNSKFKMTNIENVDPEDAFVKPLIIKGRMTELYRPFIEKADSKTIIKLGNLFGQHVELRELEKKEKDFVFANPLMRSWTIIIDFPKGVNITNMESLFQTTDFSAHKDILMSASLNLEGNVLRIKTRQVYYSHRYSIEDKEEVFNAFRYYDQLNKMNLIIE